MHGYVCVVYTLLHTSEHKTYVWCMYVSVPYHACVYNVHMCEYVCAMRCWYAKAIPPFLCPQGLGWAWPENQGRQNADMELRDSASGVR